MRFFIHKLGCPKNDCDADYIAARLVSDGHRAVAEPDEAECILVNTCGFIQPAKEESIEQLLAWAEMKKEGRLKYLFACGCLAQRYGDELVREMPELDGVFGLGQLEAVARAMKSPPSPVTVERVDSRQLTYLAGEGRYIADDFPYAYLKISDGCNRPCSYCAIPAIRGRYRSRSMEAIVDEARFLAANGKKELILVSQEATLWGYDLGRGDNIITLLEALDGIDGVEWLRLMYLHPAQVDDKLLKYIAADNKTLNYLDIPLQHVNSEILKGMRRQMDRAGVDRLMADIRRELPGATLRTTFIVGFPGESENQFEELLRAVAEYEFDRVGAFVFWAEEGTPAAAMDGQIPLSERRNRLDRLMSLQRDIALARNNSLIGNVVEVIIDAVEEDGSAVGRTRGDCPEIDQEVLVRGVDLRVGEIRSVRIDEVDGYDLVGTATAE